MAAVHKQKLYLDITQEELAKLSRGDATEGMTDKEMLFCEHYMKNYNIKIAAIKAGYKKESAHMMGWAVRKKPRVNQYICWLKLKVSQACHVEAVNIIDHYVRIAFADITDFATIKDNRIKLVNGEDIDGQLIKTVRQGRDGGVSVEMYDKIAALEKLEKYFDVMPKDWREKIEERKLDIAQQHLDIEKVRAGMISVGEEEDDGFLEAMKENAKAVWADEE